MLESLGRFEILTVPIRSDGCDRSLVCNNDDLILTVDVRSGGPGRNIPFIWVILLKKPWVFSESTRSTHVV